MTLDKAISQTPDLRDLYNNNPTIQNVINIAKRLEGLCRNAGVHAAGVIIADQPLDEVIPLCKDKDDNVLTQFEGPISEKCGLLKMDFLGLRTLSTMQRSIELVKQTKGIDVDIEQIDFTDRAVLDLFCRGETRGIFQFESGGMQDLLMKMHPDRLEDLIAANALYRPGPMELIPLYCNRKHGRELTPKVNPIVDRILEETYGIMVYQEQVMQIFNQLGGIELSNAYKLIKAISKKTADVIAKFEPDFLRGAMSHGVSKAEAQNIFELILKFGGYGFNKSHSTRYAIVAFQTAYMKTYHPVEYMAALLTFEMGSTDKIVEYIEECRRMKIRVLPPDVNGSDRDFTPVYGGEVAQIVEPKKRKGAAKAKSGASPDSESAVIRFGLCAVRGVGEKAVEAIIAERTNRGPFKSLYDFCERVDMRQVARATLEALVKCGAFSSISDNRARLLNVLDRAVEVGQQHQDDKRSGQLNMFAAAAAPRSSSGLGEAMPEIDELPSGELLKLEKELLGFYITSHPLTEHQAALEHYATASTRDAMNMSEGTDATIGGMISRVKKTVTKNGRSAGMQMANITLEDLEGQIDCTIWAEQLEKLTKQYPDFLQLEQILFLKGRIDRRRETPCLVVSDVVPIAESFSKLTTAIAVKLERAQHAVEKIRQLRPIFKEHPGNLRMHVQIRSEEQTVLLSLAKDLSVRPSTNLVKAIENVLGNGAVQVRGAGSQRRRIIEQRRLFAEESADPGTTESAGIDAAVAEMDASDD